MRFSIRDGSGARIRDEQNAMVRGRTPPECSESLGKVCSIFSQRRCANDDWPVYHGLLSLKRRQPRVF